MIRKMLLLFNLVCICCVLSAQYVQVHADYNAIGDCIFTANNNAKVPMYLHLNFADLENTTFNEPLPYVKKLTPGFNNLFTLYRDLDADIPRFNYEIKTFRSNPTSKVDLDYPYLIPFNEGEEIKVFDVQNIQGFWGREEPDSWYATGFKVDDGMPVFASRSGVVAEIAGSVRTGDAQYWYHTWTNSITLLQADGTLMCYRNIAVDSERIRVGDKVYAGEKIGEVKHYKNEMIVLIFHDSLINKNLSFVIPQFVISENGDTEILITSKIYRVFSPYSVRGLEMTKREKRKILR